MTQRVSLVRDPEFTGELTFSRAPDGSLSFEDGVAEVADDVDVEWVVARYPNLAAGDAPVPDEPDSDDDNDDDTEAPFDPGEMTNDELDSELSENDYSEGELNALLDAEEAGKDRDGAKDALQDALGNTEE